MNSFFFLIFFLFIVFREYDKDNISLFAENII